MDADTSLGGFERLERFLDEVDQVGDPRTLEEPFRTLWLRVHHLEPSSMSGLSATVGAPVQDLIPSTIEITPSPGLDPAMLERTGKIKKIEVLTLNEVGPTVEMKVDKKKLTFRMADGKVVQAINRKREAGNLMVSIQSKLVPLSGLGGEVPTLQDSMRQVAISYKEADYENAMSRLGEISEKMGSEDFKKDLLIKVQRRMSDYQQLGVEMTKAKEGFRSLATSLKENRDDFYTLMSALLKGLEDSVRGLGIEEVAVEVVEVTEQVEEVPPAKETPAEAPEPPTGGPKVKKTPEKAPEPSVAPTPPVKGPEGPKPVVKFVKKKLTLVPEHNLTSPENGPTPKAVEPRPSEPEVAPATHTPPSPSEPVKEGQRPDPTEQAAKAQPVKEEERTAPEPTEEEKAARKKEASEAFKRIQLVHKAATAMHKKGKDVGQIFDLLKYAEEARKKGDLKAYSGVSKQLESMLLAMQSKM